jgi:allantoicase
VNDLIDLASEQLGAVVVAANDEFFAPKDRLILQAAPIWRDGEYTDRGKWMDGWETRRRRDVLPGEAGFDFAGDWCIVQLGARGVIRGVDIDTTFFKGNYPDACALEACVAAGATTLYDLHRAKWQPVVERSALRGDAHNLRDVAGVDATHVRLTIFPDGGVARLRVFGDLVPDWDALRRKGEIDVAAILNGGRVVDSSDMFFGSRNNLIMPGAPRSMADGWETRRRRTPGHDWTIVRLGLPATIARVEVDTRYFKGNAPAACSLDACTSDTPGDWMELLPRSPLTPDRGHTFDRAALKRIADVTFVRLNIFPDGGVARLHVFSAIG